MSSKKGFLVRIATRLDYNLLRYGLKRFYWPAITTSLASNYDFIPSFMEYKWTMTQVLQGHNLIGFDENNLINNFIGFVINTKWSQNRSNDLQLLAKTSKDKRIIMLASMQRHIEQQSDLYKQLNCDEFFLMNNIGIHPDYYRQKLGSQLIQQSLQRANQLGFQMAIVNATDKYLKETCEKNDMNLLTIVKYSEILDAESNQPVFDSDSKKEIFVFVKKFPRSMRNDVFQ